MSHSTMFPTPCAARTVEMHHIIDLHSYCFNTNIHTGTLPHFRNNPQPPWPLGVLQISNYEKVCHRFGNTNSKGGAIVLI
jgi:hypothetical protein